MENHNLDSRLYESLTVNSNKRHSLFNQRKNSRPQHKRTHSDVHGQHIPLNWKKLKPEGKISERGFHTSVAIDKKIYIIGGDNKNSLKMNDVQEYDTETNKFKLKKGYQLDDQRTGHTCVVYDDHFYIFGGKKGTKYVSDLNIFDIKNQKWSKNVPNIKLKARATHTACVIGGKMYVYGGVALGSSSFKYLSDLIIFDFKTQSWEDSSKITGVFPSGRAAHTAISHNDIMYLFGGRDEHIFYNDMYSLSVSNSTWTKICSLNNPPPPRAGHTMNIIDGKTLLVWGGTDGQNFKQTILLFQLQDTTWREAYMSGSIPEGRFWHTAELVDDKIYIFGGANASSLFNDLYTLDVSPLKQNEIQNIESMFSISDFHSNYPKSPKVNGKKSPAPDVLMNTKRTSNHTPELLVKQSRSNTSTPDKLPTSPQRIKSDPSLSQKIKVVHDEETRAFMIPLEKLKFEDIISKLSSEYKFSLKLSYKDEEGDLISILSEDDFQEAISFFHESSTSIKFQIQKQKNDSLTKPIIQMKSINLQDANLYINPSSNNFSPKVRTSSSSSPVPVVSPPSPMPKTSFNWQKGGLLGSGSSGEVYMALNVDTGEPMAVKMIPISTDSPEGKENVKSIAKEINLMKKLNHENIVRYLGSDIQDSKTLCIFLEFVPGGSLSSLLKKFTLFHENIVRLYTRQILSGLKYLHDNNIVHRDIKGGNILLDEKGTIKLADFGHSKYLNENDSLNIKGTPLWIAPEVISSGKYTKAADIWSLGCTIIEMLTGKPPYPELHKTNPYTIMQNISKGLKPEIPEDLSFVGKDFLIKCFDTNPKTRATVDQLLEHYFVNTYFTDEEDDDFEDVDYAEGEDTDVDFASSFEDSLIENSLKSSQPYLGRKKSFSDTKEMKNSLKTIIKRKDSFTSHKLRENVQAPRIEVFEEIEESIKEEKKKLDQLSNQIKINYVGKTDIIEIDEFEGNNKF
eukprot:gene5215-8827_t